jgi:hypothetical protein
MRPAIPFSDCALASGGSALLLIHHIRNQSSSSERHAVLSSALHNANGMVAGARWMLLLHRYPGCLRQWIAAAATFALALQLVLLSIAIGHVNAWQSDTGDTFVICHGVGGNSPVNQDGPAKPTGDGSHCVLCTLTHGGSAVLPAASTVATFVSSPCSRCLIHHDAQVSEHHSPTGKFQRGPPQHTFVAG